MPINLMLILLSFAIGICVTFHIRSYDIYEKEPLSKLFLVIVWGGIWSIGVSTILYEFIRYFGVVIEHNLISAFLIIGPVEEAAKLLALLSSYVIIRKDLNEPTDGLIYMACVALGFSLIENYFYAIHDKNPGHLLFIRTLIATPAHIYFSVFMGISVYALIRKKTGVFMLLISYLYACFMHGLYNSIGFHGWVLALLGLFMWLARSKIESLLTYTSSISPFRKSLLEFVESYSETSLENGIECLNCSSKNKKQSYKLGKIFFQKCDQCSSYVVSKENLFRIFKYFGSTFSNLSKYYWDAEFYELECSRLYEGNYVNDKKKIGYFFVNELNDSLTEFREKSIEDFERKWWFPNKLKHHQSEVTRFNNSFALTITPFIILISAIYYYIDRPDTFWGLLFISWPFVIILFLVVYSVVVNLNKPKNENTNIQPDAKL